MRLSRYSTRREYGSDGAQLWQDEVLSSGSQQQQFHRGSVRAIPPECDPDFITFKEEESCNDAIRQDNLTLTGSTQAECGVFWDHFNCWPRAKVGETVPQPCPRFLRVKGSVMRNCTEQGWTEPFPPYDTACGHLLNDSFYISSEMLVSHEYFLFVKVMYTVGYTVSLISLTIAIIMLCLFRKLHCTRNYIHIQLFVSFILRAIFIFIRDSALQPSEDYYFCDSHPPGCKVALMFSNYCILANYSWLLVEGHYLHSLINISIYSQKKCLHWYILLGWGIPMVIITAWSVAKYLYEDEGCWETRSHSWIWWILRVPVILFIIVNVLFFICIIRTLVGKLRTPDMHGHEFTQCKKLAKSTFLLVSLFGIQYILFAFFPDKVSVLTFKIWNFIELALASTQGFIVAVLYCFLNGEVQNEVQRRWRKWRLSQSLHGDPKTHHSSLSHSGLPPTQISLLPRAPTVHNSSLA
ncbi:secretin receptor [Chanos chanos]|uniref:Secretin receptor n=1 Tax=Chanos chanos TaxID=29144 RepID=A0A6J2WIG1_CHACN|nr:secretin receptor-like [Chanos chanos]